MSNIKKFNKMARKSLLLQAEEYETGNIVVILRFQNIRNSWTSLTIPIMCFRSPRQLYCILLSKGFSFPCGGEPAEFCNDLSQYEFMKTSLLSSQTGWYKSFDEKYCYILPDSSFGTEHYSVLYKQDIGDNKKVPYIGTTDEYIRLLDLCKYSPPAILTVGVALASFCLFPFSAETFGIHLFGDSSIGKSTLAKIASGILGKPSDFIPWKTTEGGIEEACYTHRHRILVFDEAKLIANDRLKIAQRISDLSYFICAGQTKKRLKSYNRDNDLYVGDWELTFISTGEFGIIENAQATGHLKDNGEKLRFIDVPAQMSAKYGIFSKLPDGYDDSKQLIYDINNILLNNYGRLGREFVCCLASALNEGADSLRQDFNTQFEYFCNNIDVSAVGGYSQRFLSRFAFTYATLMLAVSWQLVPWSQERIFRAIKKMYALALNCIRDDKTILQEGLGILEEKLSKDNENYADLADLSSKEDIIAEWNNKKFFGQKIGKTFSWIIPSKTFKSWFMTPKQCILVEDYLEDLIEKDDEGYALCSLGHKVRKRAIVLNKKKLNELLSKK